VDNRQADSQVTAPAPAASIPDASRCSLPQFFTYFHITFVTELTASPFLSWPVLRSVVDQRTAKPAALNPSKPARSTYTPPSSCLSSLAVDFMDQVSQCRLMLLISWLGILRFLESRILGPWIVRTLLPIFFLFFNGLSALRASRPATLESCRYGTKAAGLTPHT